MQYLFANNFTGHKLTASTTDWQTSIEIGSGAGELSGASPDKAYILTIFDDENYEIILVTGVSGNTLTVSRGQEGTTRREWPIGTEVECRVTALALSSSLRQAGGRISQVAGSQTTGTSSISLIGDAPGDGSIAVGHSSSAVGNKSLSVGPSSYSNKAFCIAVGSHSRARGNYSASVGYYSESNEPYSMALGPRSKANGEESFSVGYFSESKAKGAQAAGARARADEEQSCAVGTYAVSGKQGAVAVGSGALASIPYTMVSHALPVAPLSPGVPGSGMAGLGRSDTFAALSWRGFSPPAEYAYRHVSQVAIVTDFVDLTTAGAAATVDMPPGTMLFIDRVDVVVTSSDGASGSPVVSVGTSAANDDSILASAAVTKTDPGGRDSHDPIGPDGVSAIHVTVSTAGAGTEYIAKVVAHGYVMEI